MVQVEIGMLKEQISSYGINSQHNTNPSLTEQECPRSIMLQSQLQTNHLLAMVIVNIIL